MDVVGLIAGSGRFPIIFADSAARSAVRVVAIGVKGTTSEELRSHVDKMHWIETGELGKLLVILKSEGIKHVVMAGKISATVLFDKKLRPDDELKSLLESLKDRKTDSLLGAVADRIAQYGIELLDSTTFLSEYLPQKGVLTQRKPSVTEVEDIEFGMAAAKQIAALDIGQTVVVKNKIILSVEAAEGTDEAIRRGAGLGNGNVVVVKVSKPAQDMRFDVPVVGIGTIRTLVEAGATVLSIESGKTLFMDKERSLDLCDSHGISVVVL
jgi:DUF1009 family protein